MAELPARIALQLVPRLSRSPAKMDTPEKPQILLLCLEYREFLVEMYGWFLTKLLEVAHVQSAKTPTAALRAISENNFKAIILADEALAEYPNPENRQVLAKIKTYIENGGLAIVGLHFPSFTRMSSFNGFFEAFGLPWVRGDYHRTTFELVSSAELPGGTAKSALPEPYSMKALHMKGARVQERMYIAAEVDSMTEYNVFAPVYVDRSQPAVAAAKLGQGYLVYCGSVNSEHESSQLILALCGFKVESD